MTNKEAYEWLNQPGIIAILPADPQTLEAIKIATESLKAKEQILAMIDELKYNIKDGISIPGCRFRFSTDTYEGAIGTLTLLKQRIEKWEAQNDR